MVPDWYPQKLADRIPWHANFSSQAAATGADFGLSPAEIAQIAADADTMEAVVNAASAAEAYVQAMTQFRAIVLGRDPDAPLPAPPTPPSAVALGPGAMAGIMARTRRFAARIKASAGYTSLVGELFGIVPPARRERSTPELSARALSGSRVRLRVVRRGHSAAAIDSRRGEGAWEQIGVSQISVFVDERPPLQPGQPEVREYRAQGMMRNQRVGDPSAAVRAVAAP